MPSAIPSNLAAIVLVLSLATTADTPSCGVARTGGRTADVRWDTYGVPHIIASQPGAAFYAFGWAQMENHANAILGLYGRARGRAAEYWGRERLKSDTIVQALEIPATAEKWYAEQDGEIQQYLDLFVAGMNDYAERYPAVIKPENRAVLPVETTDLFAHLQCVIDLGFMGRSILRRNDVSIPMGSNALALAPSRTTGGRAMLLTNPHLPWDESLYTFFEAHFKIGDRDFYGATLVGLPVLVLAFNNTLGWAHTANGLDGADLYEVDMLDRDRYRFDGAIKSIARTPRVVLVRQEQGGFERVPLTIESTVHGPVLWRKDNKAFAYRSTHTLYPHFFAQYWRMITASTLAEFRSALRMMQLPTFNVIYADRAGHVLYMWNGLLPVRARGDEAYWAGAIPGNASDTLWTKTLRFEAMPAVLDPPSGWVQNTNDAPWIATMPPRLDPKQYPDYIPQGMTPGLRLQRIMKMLDATPRVSFDAFGRIKFNERMEVADRLLDPLLRAIDATPAEDRPPLLDQARDVLQAWDRTVDAESRGAVLFTTWTRHLGNGVFERDLRNAATAVKQLLVSARTVIDKYGALDVKWGDVYRLKHGAIDLPASGGPSFLGIFHTVEFQAGKDGRFSSVSGDSYSSIVEFSDPVRAEVLLTYGNASEEGSPHIGDQLALLSARRMRKALLTLADIDSQLVKRERLPLGPPVPTEPQP